MATAQGRNVIFVITVLGLSALAMSVLQPILPLYLKSIGISLETIGLMFSMAMVAMSIGECYWGWLADKQGVLFPLSMGTFVCGLVVLCFVLTDNILFLFIIFFFWGLLRSAVFGPGRGMLGASVPPMKKATFMAILTVIMSASRSIGALPGTFIAHNFGYSSLFFIYCGIAFLGGFIMLIGLKNIKPFKEKSDLAETCFTVSEKYPGRPLKVSFLTIHYLVAALQFFSLSITIVYLPIYATSVIGTSIIDVGILFTIKGIATMLFCIPMGVLSDKIDKKSVMTFGLLLSTIAMFGFSLANSFTWLIIISIISSLGLSLFSPASLALLSNSVPLYKQNTVMGFYGGIGENTGFIAGSAVGGFIWSAWGPQYAFLTGSILSALGAIICYFFLKITYSQSYPGINY
jgi:MFS family permease